LGSKRGISGQCHPHAASAHISGEIRLLAVERKRRRYQRCRAAEKRGFFSGINMKQSAGQKIEGALFFTPSSKPDKGFFPSCQSLPLDGRGWWGAQLEISARGRISTNNKGKLVSKRQKRTENAVRELG